VANLRRPGGAFLCEPAGPVFTREMLTREQLEMMGTVEAFSRNEVEPCATQIERKEPGVLVGLLKRAGELGFLMADVPEAYGGMGADTVTSMLITESLRRLGSFSVTVGAHTGIGTLPIVFYGNEDQKRRYLPRLATGEWVAAYALTEAGSGSDALAAKTRAVREGGEYRLSGVKQWITNGAFADLFTVFAQVDGVKFTAFLVERTMPGVSVGPEEHKMGIRGSSTCELILEDARVPAENLLGEIGRGHKIAFNILNVGRLKLGIGTVGASRSALELAARYAATRRQFGKAIGEFGLVRQKLGRMAARIYAGESMGYRTAGLIDAAMAEAGHDADKARVLEEFAVEASILKIYGSECLDFAADEAVQIHGGYGFTEEFGVERMARDSRINRIFEGTNEINRLIIPGLLLKRAMKGELGLLAFVDQVRRDLAEGNPVPPAEGPLARAKHAVDVMRRVFAVVAAAAVGKHGPAIGEHQEVVGALADMAIAVYALDSATARAEQSRVAGHDASALQAAMTRVLAHDLHEEVMDTARLLAAALAEGEELAELFRTIHRFPERVPMNVFALVDEIAAACLAAGGYPG
jgi:alkylation response protein AidB-like acyl-CoA dehydrogenase